ncbi:hypothetical protein M8J76_015786 [Diaphorina citri]|nr:hypothetical protein M8J76_015786 [Diaphorina citri]
MPPVVLLDRKARAAQPCDLTFGFEINKQLLNRGGDLAAKEAVRLGSAAAADCRTDCFNYTDIVNFIGNAWKDVMKEFASSNKSSSSRIHYYTNQSTASMSSS